MEQQLSPLRLPNRLYFFFLAGGTNAFGGGGAGIGREGTICRCGCAIGMGRCG